MRHQGCPSTFFKRSRIVTDSFSLVPVIGHCIHRIASSGYYGFRFVTPPPPQCVERFHHYHSNKENIIASLLKFAGYIHNHKILPGNIFENNFEKQDGRHRRFFLLPARTFVGLLEQRVL